MSPRGGAVPALVLERVLELAGVEMILVGGQALAFWASFYGTAEPTIAITRDIDLLGKRADVERLARGLGAAATFPSAKERTSLVGQIQGSGPGGESINIDVLFRVYGDVTPRALAQRSVLADNAAGTFRVMHPLDVLQGRLENVHGLAGKRDEHGLAQLALAIEMVRGFLRDFATRESEARREERRPLVLRHLGRIEALALSDAGRKVARRHHLYVADAIDPGPVLHLERFVTKKLPSLLELMSPARRAELERRR